MNIVILTGRFGMGHYSVSTTLYNKIKKDFPNANVYIKDFFEVLLPKSYTRIYDFYTWLINNLPYVYNTYYRLTQNNKKLVKPYVVYNLFKAMTDIVDEINPDIVICTLPIATQTAGFYKRKYNQNYKLITCITDISFHTEWINVENDYYMVGSEEVKNNLSNFNIDKDKIIVSGIPVKEEFTRDYKKEESKERKILIMGGGLGLIPEDKKFYQELNSLENTKTIIILGNNRNAYLRLYNKYENIQVIGYTNEVYKYMREADILVSKPGGITTYESIWLEKPMLVLTPFLSQEIKNAKFIEKNNFGNVIWDKKANIVIQIESLLNNQKKLNQMKENMVIFKQNINNMAIKEILDSVSIDQSVCVNRVNTKAFAINI